MCCNVNIFVTLACVLFFALVAGLVTVSVIYVESDETQYLTNCTVTLIGSKCYLVRPVSGEFTFPYVYNQTPEYLGDAKPCGLIDTLVPCYIYKGQKGGDPEDGVPGVPFVGVTTSESKARMTDYETLFGLILGFAIGIVVFLIICCGCIVHARRDPNAGYEQL